MKLHFEPDLDYQHDAIEAVCDLFRGQEICRTEFTVALSAPNGQLTLGVEQSDLGVGNRLAVADAELLANLREIQLRNGIAPSASLDSRDFTVEMETGTGKTYVYLRTIYELNKRYGFSKFVIVVPSIAIKEGVYKTLQMTEEQSPQTSGSSTTRAQVGHHSPDGAGVCGGDERSLGILL